MSQFGIHRNTGKSQGLIRYVLVVQSSLFAKSRRRVVVQLVSAETLGMVAQLPSSAVNPVFEVEGVPVVLNPLEIFRSRSRRWTSCFRVPGADFE